VLCVAWGSTGSVFENRLGFANTMAFYLTDNNYIISTHDDSHDAVTYSGLSIQSFESLLNSVVSEVQMLRTEIGQQIEENENNSVNSTPSHAQESTTSTPAPLVEQN
jgi:hypothetical protein